MQPLRVILISRPVEPIHESEKASKGVAVMVVYLRKWWGDYIPKLVFKFEVLSELLEFLRSLWKAKYEELDYSCE